MITTFVATVSIVIPFLMSLLQMCGLNLIYSSIFLLGY